MKGLGEKRGGGCIPPAGTVLGKRGFLPPLHPELRGCSEVSGFRTWSGRAGYDPGQPGWSTRKPALCNRSIRRGGSLHLHQGCPSLSWGRWERSSAPSLWRLEAGGDGERRSAPMLRSPRVDLPLSSVLSTAPAFCSRSREVGEKAAWGAGYRRAGSKDAWALVLPLPLTHCTALVMSLHCPEMPSLLSAGCATCSGSVRAG